MMSPKCSIFPTFSFSLINKTHRRCQDSPLFHSQRFSFEFLFTLKRWKRAFRTSRQNKTYFSRKCVQSVSDNVLPVTNSAQQNVPLLQLDGRTTGTVNPPTHATGTGATLPKPLSFDHCSTKALSAKKMCQREACTSPDVAVPTDRAP